MAELTEQGKEMLQQERDKRRQAYEDRQKMFQERKERMIKRDNTRVVFARTRDTAGLLALVQAGDLAVRRLRDGMGINFDITESSRKIQEYNAAIKDYAIVVNDLCDYANVDFKAPKWILGEEDEQKDGKKETLTVKE